MAGVGLGQRARKLNARIVGLVIALPLGCTSAAAHEYWLDPLDATPDVDGRLLLNVRNGENFSGSSFPFDPERMRHVALVGPGGSRDLRGRLGDFPAVDTVVGEAGLYLVTLETGARPLLYDDLTAFETFVDYHGAEGVLARHVERGLPDTGIRELYFRYAKSLVRTGSAAGKTAVLSTPVFEAQDMLFELVPGNDPTDDDSMTVSLLFDGAPIAEAQVELFRRSPENVVDRRIARTDDTGRVQFDVAAPGDYLVNAVRIVEPDDETESDSAAPHWISHWASLTFERQ